MIRVVDFKTEFRPGKTPIDWVLIAPMGEDFTRTQTWHRVEKVRPDEKADSNVKESLSYKDMAAKWTIIGPAYEAWKNGQEIPDEGTPLAAWSGVTADQARALQALDVRTVEDVRDMGDAVMQNLRLPNARQLPKLAKEFLEGSTAAEKDAKIAEMEEKMRAMEEMLEESMSAPKEKAKRGRPRKQDSEAA